MNIDRTFHDETGTLLTVGMGDVIRQQRNSLGLSQADLAARLGVDVRQIRRYEADTAQPTLQGARLMADVLGVTLDELVGTSADYSGEWCSAWQGSDERPQLSRVVLARRASALEVSPIPNADGLGAGAWRGELKTVSDNLLGWFARDYGHPRRGTITLEPYGDMLRGGWLGADLSSGVRTGYLVLARDADKATEYIDELVRGPRTRFDQT